MRPTAKPSPAPSGTPRVLLLSGRDNARKLKLVEDLLARVVDPAFRAFDALTLEARGAAPGSVLATLRQAPIVSQRKVVVLRGVERLKAPEAAALAAILPSIPDTGCLVLVTHEEETPGKPSATATQRLVTAVGKAGAVVPCEPPRPAMAPAFVMQAARSLGLRMDGAAVHHLVERVGPDQSVLQLEMEKLAAYAGEAGVVTREVVAQVSSASAEHTVFNLVDAIADGSAAGAMEALDSLMTAGLHPLAIVPHLLRQLRLLWQVKALAERGPVHRNMALPDAPDILLRDPSLYRMAWKLDALAAQAEKLGYAGLEAGFAAVSDADQALKGMQEGAEDPRIIMERLVLRLCGGRRQLVQPLHQS